jgi:hypothetical protein
MYNDTRLTENDLIFGVFVSENLILFFINFQLADEPKKKLMAQDIGRSCFIYITCPSSRSSLFEILVYVCPT